MRSFTQAEVSRICNVSRVTVNRWVELSIEGKNNLQLDTSTNKVRILDNAHNEAELKRLSATASKYQGGEVKKVVLSEEFYKFFSFEERIEIFNDLQYNSQINLKYVYKNVGAEYWDKFYRNSGSKVVDFVDEVLDICFEDFLYYLPKNSKTNIIDIGPGNGYPVKNLLQKLDKTKRLSKYLALDISEEINHLTVNNIKKWFPDLQCLSYQADVEYGKVSNIFLENKEKNESNLILHLGNTLCNYNDRLQVLKHLSFGITPDDLLVLTFTLDVPENKAEINYVKNDDSGIKDWLPRLLGIDIENCEIVGEYNEKLNCKTAGFQLDKDYEIEFKLANRTETLYLKAGQTINDWKHYLVDIVQFVEEARAAKLEILELKTDNRGSNALAICRIKH
jgi:uncharacterized SAM-dependent methyltransferase